MANELCFFTFVEVNYRSGKEQVFYELPSQNRYLIKFVSSIRGIVLGNRVTFETSSRNAAANFLDRSQLVKLKLRAMRAGVWFRGLPRLDRVLVDLTIDLSCFARYFLRTMMFPPPI